MPPPRPPPAKAEHWDSSRTAGAASARANAGLTKAATPKVRLLMTESAGAESDAALARLIDRTADLIIERSESMARERLQAARWWCRKSPRASKKNRNGALPDGIEEREAAAI